MTQIAVSSLLYWLRKLVKSKLVWEGDKFWKLVGEKRLGFSTNMIFPSFFILFLIFFCDQGNCSYKLYWILKLQLLLSHFRWLVTMSSKFFVFIYFFLSEYSFTDTDNSYKIHVDNFARKVIDWNFHWLWP